MVAPWQSYMGQLHKKYKITESPADCNYACTYGIKQTEAAQNSQSIAIVIICKPLVQLHAI